LADILRPSLRENDFQTEKKVIKDEIARYEVRPDWSVYDQSRKLFFGDHPLGQSILGTRESIDCLAREQMLDYVRRRYAAGNIVGVAGGHWEGKGLGNVVEEHGGGWKGGKSALPRTKPEPPRRPVLHSIPREKLNQEYVMMWAPAPPADSPLRYAAHVLMS